MTYRSELYLIKSDNTEIPANIIANTLYLNKSYCEEEQLELGGCIPSQFKCSVYGIEDITDIVKLKYIRYSDNEPDISFEGIIEELTSTSNDGIYNITAYDVLYNQDDISAWYNNYMATHQNVTITQLYSAVLEKLGLISGSVITNYITYDFVIKQNILSNNIAGTRLLKWICEALGVFGILNTYTSTNETENGIRYTTMTTFSLNVLGPKPKTAIRPTTVFSGFQKSDYICKKMDKVQIRSEEEDIGAIYGTGTNALIIEGNPLFYGMNASELEKCAKQISGNIKDNSDYTAYEAELADSDIYINNVDIYQCYPISSSTSHIYSYIFNITWSGSQLTTCKIGANGVETRSEVLTSTNSEIIKLNYKTTSIVKNVDGIKTEVSSISSKADNALNKIDNLQIGGTNLIRGTHKTAVTYSYPASNFADYFYSKTTTPLNGDTYTLSFWAKSTVDGDIITTHFYNPNNVTSLNGSQGQHSTANPDGRCKFTLSTVLTKYWVTYTIPKNSNSTKNVIIPRLWSGDGKGEVTVQWEKLEEGNKATDWSPAPEDIEEQITSAKTSIEQTDKYIEAKVVKNDEVVTKINASTEGVNIKADKISLEGYTTINDNFKIDEKGNMEAKNGKFSGEITSTSGTIGGWTISEGKLSVNIGGYEMVLNASDDSKPAMYILDKREGSTVMLPFFLEKDGSVRFTSISANEYRSIMCNGDIFLKLHQSDTYNGSVLGLFYSVEDIKSKVNDVVIGLHFRQYVDKLTANVGVQIAVPYTTPEGYKYMITTSVQSYGCATSCAYQGVNLGSNVIYVYVYPFDTNAAYIEATVLFIKN